MRPGKSFRPSGFVWNSLEAGEGAPRDEAARRWACFKGPAGVQEAGWTRVARRHGGASCGVGSGGLGGGVHGGGAAEQDALAAREGEDWPERAESLRAQARRPDMTIVRVPYLEYTKQSCEASTDTMQNLSEVTRVVAAAVLGCGPF
eukprot:156374-Rhodomonas_salina.1